MWKYCFKKNCMITSNMIKHVIKHGENLMVDSCTMSKTSLASLTSVTQHHLLLKSTHHNCQLLVWIFLKQKSLWAVSSRQVFYARFNDTLHYFATLPQLPFLNTPSTQKCGFPLFIAPKISNLDYTDSYLSVCHQRSVFTFPC